MTDVLDDPLAELRKEQDQVDLEIVAVIAKRYAIRKKISAFRAKNHLLTVDPARMQYVLDQARNYAAEFELPEEMINELFHLLIDWSHKLDRQWRSEKQD